MQILGPLLFATQVYTYCKVTVDSPLWPPNHAWQALNASISGRLVASEPPGAVCYKNEPEYNAISCLNLQSQWTNSSFHRDSPITVDNDDDTCSPVLGNSTCSAKGYPAYVIAAESASDVQAGIKFAASNRLRLIIKGTGHDYLGRSSGAGALSIWTRGLQGIEFSEGKVKIMAASTVKDILTAAGEKNLTVITGSDPGVGIGGWLAGAGHGPLTTKYGMGADQVLEMEVVTADGKFLTINDKQHSDLFWAMRGGGASTYAVMISATVKTYPDIPVVLLNHNYTTTAESKEFWDMLTLFHNEIPYLSDSGVMGYYYATDNSTEAVPNMPDIGIVIGIFIVPEKSVQEAQDILLKMEAKFQSTSFARTSVPVSSFTKAWVQNAPGAVGGNSRLGSRLLDKKALSSPKLRSALQEAIPRQSVRVLLGNLVAGRKTVDDAVLPAWRTAYTHLIIPVSWTEDDKITKAKELQARLQALKDLAPDMGAYMSESDPLDPDWKEAFYGSNYPRLLAIKQKWDPAGLFWCSICVGNDLWTRRGGDAIGQDPGQICKK